MSTEIPVTATVRTPLSEEQKQVLRDRLAKARAAKSAKAPKPTSVAKPKASSSLLSTFPAHIPWTDTDWNTAPLNECIARLEKLFDDRERGGRIVGQRQTDEHVTPVYKCLVCKKPVIDGLWAWKNDRLNQHTGLFTSDVICSQACYDRFSNNAAQYLEKARQ